MVRIFTREKLFYKKKCYYPVIIKITVIFSKIGNLSAVIIKISNHRKMNNRMAVPHDGRIL